MPRFILFAVLLLAATVGRADDTHSLKFYKAKEGEVYMKTKESKSTGRVTFAVGDQKGNEEQKPSETMVFTEEILTFPKDAKRPTKLKRTYEKVEKKDVKGDEVKSHLVGKTVVIERQNDKWVYTVDGKPPTDDQTKELDADFGDERADAMTPNEMLPGKAVKVGDTWAVDVKKAVESLGDLKGTVFDLEKSSFTGKLVKAETKDGVLRGTVEFTLKLALTDFGLGENQALPTEAGSDMTMKVVMDGCLDGSVPGEKSEMTMKVVVKAKLPMDGKFEMTSTTTAIDTEELAKKK